jgi:hypothetical protein
VVRHYFATPVCLQSHAINVGFVFVHKRLVENARTILGSPRQQGMGETMTVEFRRLLGEDKPARKAFC